MGTKTYNYEIFEDGLEHGIYRVEAVETKGDGKVSTTIFTGPDAKDRATEYMHWKNSDVISPRKSAENLLQRDSKQIFSDDGSDWVLSANFRRPDELR